MTLLWHVCSFTLLPNSLGSTALDKDICVTRHHPRAAMAQNALISGFGSGPKILGCPIILWICVGIYARSTAAVHGITEKATMQRNSISILEENQS